MKCKKLLCLGMVAALVCVGLSGMTVPAEEIQVREESVEAVGIVEEYYEYKEGGDGTLTITGYNGSDIELVIPSEIGGKRVTSIGSYAFRDCWELTSVTIPGSVMEIEMAAFAGSGLTSVTILEGVMGIGNYAFNGCRELTSVIIPGSVKYMGERAFNGCSALTSVEISEGVTSIGFTVFLGCSSLTSITIPGSVTSIDASAFNRCSSLTDIHVAEGNENYTSEDGILYDKAKTELFRCPEGKKGSILIPESVTGIGNSAFTNCSGLMSINVAEENVNYISEDGVLYNKTKTELVRCPEGKGGFIVIPEGVASIGKSAFTNCGSLTEIKIPGSVTSIENGAFYNCGSLTEIKIPGSVTSIGNSAFYGCSNLKDIYYGGSQEQWNNINIDRNLGISPSTIVHCNSSQSGDKPGTSDTEQKSQKKAQSITAGNMTKTYGEKPFSLGATALGGASLSYASSNGKVASVALDGTVTVTDCGVTQITVMAAETKDYKAASKTVTLTVKPKKLTLVSVKSQKKKTVLAKWKRDTKASGYLIECAADKKFKKNKVRMTVSKNKTVSATVKKLKGGKKYYVRICAYAKDGKKKIQGDWSKPKTVKVKK